MRLQNITYKALLTCTLLLPLTLSAEEIRDSGSIPTLGGSACNLIYSPSDATWQINRFALDENLNESSTLFSTQSNASIQSVACDVAGENAYFAYKVSELDDFDIYRLALNEEGASPTPLTNNTVDDTNVSISEDGAVIAWQTELADGRQAVEIQENLADGSIETRTLSSANHYLQPSLSQNGEWLSLVQRRTGSDLVFKYHLEDAAFTRLSTVPRRKGAYNPSINNDGDKVAWVEGKGKNVLILHTAETTPARQTILSNANGIGHPFLADNGSMVIYSVYRDRKGFTYVYDLERDQQYRVGATLRGQLYSASTWLTAQSNNQCSVTSLQFNDEDLVEGTDIHVKKANFWPTSTCASTIRTDNGDHYAKHYTFELKTKKVVNIWLKSINKTGAGASHLVLTKGNTGTGEVITTTEDRIEEPQAGVLITELLEPGQYTIEATSAYRFLDDVYFQLEVATDDVSNDSTFDDCSVESISESAFSYDVYGVGSARSPMDVTLQASLKYGDTPDCHTGAISSVNPRYTRYYSFELENDHVIEINASIVNDAYGFGDNAEITSALPTIKIIKGGAIDGIVIAEGSHALSSPLLTRGTYTLAVEVSQLGFFQREFNVNLKAVSLYNVTSCPPIQLALDRLNVFKELFYAACKSETGTGYSRQFVFSLNEPREVSFTGSTGQLSGGALRLVRGGTVNGEVIEEFILENGYTRALWQDKTLPAGDYLIEIETHTERPLDLAPASLSESYLSFRAVNAARADCTTPQDISMGQTIEDSFALGEGCWSNEENQASHYYSFTLDETTRLNVSGVVESDDDYAYYDAVYYQNNDDGYISLLEGNALDGTELVSPQNASLTATLEPGTYIIKFSKSMPAGLYYPQKFTLTLDNAQPCTPIVIPLNTKTTERVECQNSDTGYAEDYIFELTQQEVVLIQEVGNSILFSGTGSDKVALNLPLVWPNTLEAGTYTISANSDIFVNTNPECHIRELVLGETVIDDWQRLCAQSARYYRFTIDEAQTITFDVTSRIYPEVVFYNDEGNILTTSEEDRSLEQSSYTKYFRPGTYTAMVKPGFRDPRADVDTMEVKITGQ